MASFKYYTLYPVLHIWCVYATEGWHTQGPIYCVVTSGVHRVCGTHGHGENMVPPPPQPQLMGVGGGGQGYSLENVNYEGSLPAISSLISTILNT